MAAIQRSAETDTLGASLGSVRRNGMVLIALFMGLVLGCGGFLPITQAVVAKGHLRSTEPIVTIRQANAGMLEAVLVQEGERVIRGQVLARVDATKLQLEANAARRLLELLQGEQSQLSGGAIEGSLPKLSATDILRLSELDRHIIEQEQRVELLELRIASANITSPVNGIVRSLRYATEGTFVPRQETLMQIVPHQDLSLVEFPVSGRDAAKLSQGLVATVIVGAQTRGDHQVIPAKVTSIVVEQDLSERNRVTRKALLELDPASLLGLRGEESNASGLWNGMPVSVRIEVGQTTLLAYLARPLRRLFDSSFQS